MKIIYSDIDGTLYDTVTGVHPEDVKAIESFISQGNKFVLISGRNPDQVQEFIRETGLHVDFVFGNGAGYCLQGSDPIYKHVIDKQKLKAIDEVVKKENVFYHYHTNIGVILEPIERYEKHFEALYQLFTPLGQRGKDLVDFKYNYFKSSLQVDDPYQYMIDNHLIITKLELTDANQEGVQVVQSAMEALDMYVYSSFMSNLEIVPKDCQKATMIKELNEMFHPTITYGFGDAKNDLSLFEVVDVAVAVENAVPELKEKSNVVTKSCQDGGVGIYIREMILTD